MADNLVIVESPAKAKTIEKFLGKDFIVKSSFGHVRDLEKKDFGVDIQNNFLPNYIVPADKKKIVTELKSLTKKAKTVWLAADEDREGEAIAWHLYQVLELEKKETKRIVFHEITKDAIINAIKNPREIDYNLVNSQQARRVLDRLVGFELSPVLWRKIKPSLSAGRVQSVAVRLIVEREREIQNYNSEISFKTTGIFKNATTKNDVEFKAEVPSNFIKNTDAEKFLTDCINSDFTITDVNVKPTSRKPAPPFTTSTLQQEAGRKFGFSVSQTMSIAQKLYEAGHITYMRTDSVNLSSLAINTTVAEITSEYGENFVKIRNFTTKTKGAQEAHEAIRPTYISNKLVSDGAEQKLYDLIRKRTLASQMADAILEKTTAKIEISKSKIIFVATGEVVKFEGFLKAYSESTDDENQEQTQAILPALFVGDKLDAKSIISVQKYSNHPARYTEASLVKKLEEQGIGRPSTYAPTITTIQKREYVVKENRDPKERIIEKYTLKNNSIKKEKVSEKYDYEKSKLFPTDIGTVVNDFLVENFKTILDYSFTADVELKFDIIAQGNMEWTKMMKEFYTPFHETIQNTLENSQKNTGEKLLGNDPKTGKHIYVKIGRFGPMVQLGESLSKEEQKANPNAEKPQFAGIPKNISMNDLDLNQAIELFKLPRNLGDYENKKVVAAIGRFGPYISHNSKFVSLKKDIDDPYTVTLDRAIELINEKQIADENRIIKAFESDGIEVLNGRFGPYIKFKKKNFKIPKTTDASKILLDDCKLLIENQSKSTPSKKTGKKSFKPKN